MIPSLSHKRLFIINSLLSGGKLGTELRAAMNAEGWHVAQTKFSSFMIKLEAQGLVTSEYQTQRIGNRTFYGNIYILTDHGRELYSQAIDWYRRIASLQITKEEHVKI